MESSSSAGQIVDAMEAAEPQEASATLQQLIQNLRIQRTQEIDLSGMWVTFRRLLHRRGYFVDTPARIAASLEEIASVGEGFDLFELARGLAVYDAQAECLGLTKRRALPELQRFAPVCACGNHRMET